MRIVTWNVLGLTGYPSEFAQQDIGRPGSDSNAEHFADIFDRFDADLIALQEGVSHSVAQTVARRMGRFLATVPSPGAWPGHVLSRFPLHESRVFSHTVAAKETPPFSRTAGATRVTIDADHPLWLVNVHLHPGEVELRRQEGDILRRRLGELIRDGDPAIVVGDFNCDVDEAVHGHLRKLGFLNAMATAGGGLQLTMDTAGIRPWKIDHIYVSPDLGGLLTDAFVERGAGFRTDPPRGDGVWDHSDHLPVVADLAWPS